jgi:hypothetical protein
VVLAQSLHKHRLRTLSQRLQALEEGARERSRELGGAGAEQLGAGLAGVSPRASSQVTRSGAPSTKSPLRESALSNKQITLVRGLRAPNFATRNSSFLPCL